MYATAPTLTLPAAEVENKADEIQRLAEKFRRDYCDRVTDKTADWTLGYVDGLEHAANLIRRLTR